MNPMDTEFIKQMATDMNKAMTVAFEQGQKFAIKQPIRDIDDAIENLITDLDFDDVVKLAKHLGVEVNPPPTDDMWPDWENELAVEVGDAFRKVFK